MKLFDPTMPFYKGNTHAHSTQSDGRLSPEEVFETYHSAGYDFLALTDHWRVAGEQRYNGMLVIPGVEYDFNFQTQVLHLVCLYQKAEDARGITRGIPHQAVIEHVNKVGGHRHSSASRLVVEHAGVSEIPGWRGDRRSLQYDVGRALQWAEG